VGFSCPFRYLLETILIHQIEAINQLITIDFILFSVKVYVGWVLGWLTMSPWLEQVLKAQRRLTKVLTVHPWFNSLPIELIFNCIKGINFETQLEIFYVSTCYFYYKYSQSYSLFNLFLFHIFQMQLCWNSWRRSLMPLVDLQQLRTKNTIFSHTIAIID